MGNEDVALMKGKRMGFLRDRFSSIFSRILPRSKEECDNVRDIFKNNYRQFRSLLTANNNALELMSELEFALRSGRPFSMGFIRSRISALGFQVNKMIVRLQGISDGKYENLPRAYNRLAEQIEAILSRQPVVTDCPLVIDLDHIDRHMADQVGEKMANLGEIANRIGLKVPPGFVISVSATEHFFSVDGLIEEINRRMTICNTDDLEDLYATSEAITKIVMDLPIPPELERKLTSAYRRLEEKTDLGPGVAVRSSALGEDGGRASFAGQFHTRLRVQPEMLQQVIKEVLASIYQSQAIIYRLQRGFRHEDMKMCVGCMAMVDARFGGVAFTRSPADLSLEYMVINVVEGVPDHLVDGRADPDKYYVSRSEPHAAVQAGSGGTRTAGCIGEELLGNLARTALRIERHFGAPQDIEWAIDRNGSIVILQSRPISMIEAVVQECGTTAVLPEAGDENTLLRGGLTAAHGMGCGPVRVVRNSSDLLEFEKGSVLVVRHPLPEWATLLARASAVISETGSVAAHLATVAREFGIPALFGLNGAIEKLGGAELVTVDADNCRVIAGRCPSIAKRSAVAPNLMEGSPVYNILQELLKLTTPLNLTDPASLQFRPSGCKTLHDITRFCHEKAVKEMFSFSTRHRFDEKAAKQLVGESPYQWWIINLDDGFVDDYDIASPYVHIDQIVSVPMLAIWQGMTAIPWAGPPPVSLKGFGSILMQSMMNRDLEPAVRSQLPDKNYFMISRNFCNLSVRLGYHFSLAETHVSSLLTENYASFTFKGGAADERRRLVRIELIEKILSDNGFRVDRKRDTMTARIEKRRKEFILPRLKIIGYLLMHTRQLDMVMDQPGMVNRYLNKISSDIELILQEKIHENGGVA